MKRGRSHFDPSSLMTTEPKRIRGSSSTVPMNLGARIDVHQPPPEKDGEVSPKSHPVAAASGLRVINTSSTSPRSGNPPKITQADKGKQKLIGTPILDAGADFVFLNQDGQPITMGREKYVYSSSNYEDGPERFVLGSSADEVFQGRSDLKPLPGPFHGESQWCLLDPEDARSSTVPESAESSGRRPSTPGFRHRHPSEDYVGFNGIKPEIERLLIAGLWVNRPREDFTIKKMPGGSYNRIVSVSVKQPQPFTRSKSQKLKRTLTKMRGKVPAGELERFSKFRTTHTSGDFILRIPRLYRSTQAKYDFEAGVIMHDFVQDLGIDCPKIVTYAPKDNGVVPFPYLLQEKVAGKPLLRLYHVMTTEQRVQIASQVGTICRKMIETTYTTHGSLRKLGPVPQYGGTIARELTFSEPLWVWPRGSSKTKPVFRVLQQGLLSHKRTHPRIDWRGICEIAEELEAKGAFGRSGGWYFTHGDFFPRNMMGEITPDGQARVTSVLDWDTATFQPAVMACKPPSWLWQWNIYMKGGDEDNLDISAGMPPSNERDAAIKKAFDEAAGPEYCRIAYHPYAYTARKICLWTQIGLDNRNGRGSEQWMNWFVDNWQTFEQDVRDVGFPVDKNGGIILPLYI